jgi:tetratricopeptide (TPR) repeat protein
LAASGVGTDRVRRGVALLKKFMPDLEQPLERLAQLATTDGRLLVRLEDGDLAEPDGQLHFEFGSAGATAPASTLRIAPGPRTAADWLAQGLEQEQEGFLQEAAASYREALLAGGPDAQTCLNLANVLRALGSRPQALERYAQAVETDPRFVDAWNNMGTLLVELGRADDAVAAFRRALDAEPEDARSHYNLADTLDDLGRTAEAAPHWRAYLRHDPSSEWGRHARRRLGGASASV